MKHMPSSLSRSAKLSQSVEMPGDSSKRVKSVCRGLVMGRSVRLGLLLSWC